MYYQNRSTQWDLSLIVARLRRLLFFTFGLFSPPLAVRRVNSSGPRFARARVNAKQTTTGEGFEYIYGLRLVSAVWLRVLDVDVSPSRLVDGKGAG